jgi:hypothetical protein
LIHVRVRFPCSWQGWARRRHQKAARLHVALSLHHRRLLQAALGQWRWLQHSKVCYEPLSSLGCCRCIERLLLVIVGGCPGLPGLRGVRL